MGEQSIEDSLITGVDNNSALVSYITDLKDSVREKADVDYELAKKAGVLCEGIKKDYNAISNRIREQNEAAGSLLDHVKKVGDTKGIVGKLGAAGKLVGTVLSRVPVIKQTKNIITNAGPVSKGLEEQFQLVIVINQQIYEKLYSDDGIKAAIKGLGTNYESYLGDVVNLKQKMETIESELDKINKERDDILHPFLKKHDSHKFDSIDIRKLNAESLREYQNIERMNRVIDDLISTGIEYKDMEERIVNQFDGVKSQLKTVGVYLVQGRSIYEKIKTITDNAAVHKDVLGTICELESLVVEGAGLSTKLMENFNDIYEATARHAEQLAREGDNLIPKYVYRGSTLQKVDESNNNSLKHLRESGQLKRYQKAISVGDGSGPDVLDCEPGNSSAGNK